MMPTVRIAFALAAIVVANSSPPSFAQEEEKPLAEPKPPAVATSPSAAEPVDETAQYAVETIATGLDNPCGIAIRAGATPTAPYDIFVSESAAGRVIRYASDKPGEAAPAITGFPVESYKTGPEYRIGPLGLVFITRTKLAVGTAGLDQGEDLVRVYALPEDRAPIGYDQADHSVGPVPKGPRTKTGEENFYGLARTEDGLFVTANGDDDEGWVLKARLDANRLNDLQPFLATNRVLGVTGPVAATVNPKQHAHYLVVGQMGDIKPVRDSVVGMFGPTTGALAMSFQAGLYDIAGLDYSLAGELYAVDFARDQSVAGGVYRLDAAEVDGRQSCRPVKVASAVRPTSLAFGPDGAMYVTAFGDRNEPAAPPTGVLLKITPAGTAPPF